MADWAPISAGKAAIFIVNAIITFFVVVGVSNTFAWLVGGPVTIVGGLVPLFALSVIASAIGTMIWITLPWWRLMDLFIKNLASGSKSK